MIRVGFKVLVFSPKDMANGNTMFSILDYDKKNPNDKNYITVFCSHHLDVQEKQKVIITSIDGIGSSKYKGQSQCSMSCTAEVMYDDGEQPNNEYKPVEKTEKIDEQLKDMSGPLVDISSDDLPF